MKTKIMTAVLALFAAASVLAADPVYPTWVNTPNKVTAATAPLTLSGGTIAMPAADATHNGYVTTGTQTIAGAKTLSGNTAVGGTLTVTGAATLSSTAAVTGNATVGGTLGVTGASTLASAGVTGAATVGTTLGVTGASTLTGGVTIGSGGSAVSLSKRCTATLATASITNGTTVSQSIACTGAVVGAACSVGAPATLEAGLIQSCVVSAADTILLRTANVTAAPVVPAGSQTVGVRFWNN